MAKTPEPVVEMETSSFTGLLKLVGPLLAAYALKQVGEIASYDNSVNKPQTLAVLRCVKAWVAHGFKRKAKKK